MHLSSADRWPSSCLNYCRFGFTLSFWILTWFIIMRVVERLVVAFDFLAVFIITRYPYLEIFLLLMSMGDKGGQIGSIRSFTESLQQRENVIVYVHAAVYFLCATGMTLDIKRRQSGFAAFIHLVIVTALSVIENGSRWPETLTVSRLHVFVSFELGLI